MRPTREWAWLAFTRPPRLAFTRGRPRFAFTRGPARLAPVALALALAGCGTSGYGTVNRHELVLIPTAPTAAGARRAGAALICGARAEARRLRHALRLERPRTDSPSAQIAVANTVTAEKPGGVLIVPVARNATLAPILSMSRAGIRVVRLSLPHDPGAAASEGARGVAAVVGAIDGNRAPTGVPGAVTLLAQCASAP